MKEDQATGEAFIPQKRPSSTSKHDISTLSIFGGYFALLDLDPDPEPLSQCGWVSSRPKSMRIRIHINNIG
jgi:hypothetical protein